MQITTKAKNRRQQGEKFAFILEKLGKIFKNSTGHDLQTISSFNNFIRLLHTNVDAASLGICRMLFGMMMLLDIPEERSGSDLDLRWGETKDCRFSLFPFIKPFSLAKMGLVYGIMWLGAIGITLGYKFKSSCFAFFITYWYIFLLDKSSWNNHSYLYGLVGFLYLFTDAHHFCSIDAWRNKFEPKVPFWNYFILKFQFFILYFIAGLKKFSFEWLEGYSMTNLSHHWIFTPFRLLLGVDFTNLLMIHWFATIFDTSIVFFLIYRKTRVIATFFALAFHLMNSRIFNIGMFPFVCIAELPLFYECNWPRTIWKKQKCSSLVDEKIKVPFTAAKGCTLKEKITTVLILFYCCIQLFLPYSHFITKGYYNWRHIYGYSWDMMMDEWSTMLVSIKVVDHGNKKQHFIKPLAFTDSYRWTQYPDMAFQYANCINENLKRDFHENPQSILQSDNFSIYFDIWYSLNGRFQQRIYNPTVDLLKSDWNPFRKSSFTLPLLTEFSYLRKDILEIANEVYSWNNYTDVLFIADFPNLTFDNYILPIMDNVTLTVLKGIVRVDQGNDTMKIHLSEGQSISIKSGVFHKISTISDVPSCYMYTYINVTRQAMKFDPIDNNNHHEKVMLLQEIKARYENYKKFLYHVANSILFEFYGVPMPRRLREIQDF